MRRLEVRGAVRPLYGSLGVKGLIATAVRVFWANLILSTCRLHLFFCLGFVFYHVAPISLHISVKFPSLSVAAIMQLTRLAHFHHHHPWIRYFDLFRHRRVASVSWGVHDPFVLGVCIWGRVSGDRCYPFSQGCSSSSDSVWFLHLLFQGSLVLFSWFRFLFCLTLCIP